MSTGTVVIGGGGSVPLGYQQISAATLAAATALTPPAGTNVAIVTMGVAAPASVRWRDDGVAPTATVGMLMTTGQQVAFSGPSLAAVKFILQGAGPILDISYY
jgi:hypothetical protein